MDAVSRKALRQGELQIVGKELTGDDFKKILLAWTSPRESCHRRFLQRFKGGVDGILAVLPPDEPISMLDISENPIGDAGTSYLHLLPSTVVDLRLRACGLTAAGFKTVCDMMKTNTSIMMLNLSCNFTAGDVAAKHVSDMLKMNTTLKHLKINGCSFAPEGFSYLSEALQCNDTLQLLVAGDWPLPFWTSDFLTGDEHVLNLCPALSGNKGLLQLYLYGRISEQTKGHIAHALEQNVHLRVFSCLGCGNVTENEKKINYYLKLNRLNRKLVYNEDATLLDLRDAIIASAKADCLDAVFWFVRNKPEICVHGISS